LNEEFEIVGEKNFHYNKLPVDDNNDNDCEKKSKKLIGYFQSYRYFESYFDTQRSNIGSLFVLRIAVSFFVLALNFIELFLFYLKIATIMF
jgi:hypothetical protein